MIPKTELRSINVRYRPMTSMVPDGSLLSGLLVMGSIGNDLRKAQYSLLDWAFFLLDCVPIIVCNDQDYFNRVITDWRRIKGIPEDALIENAIGSHLEDIKRITEQGKLPFVVALDAKSFPTFSEYDDRPYATLRNFALKTNCLVGAADPVAGSFSNNKAMLDADYVFLFRGDWNEPDECPEYSCNKLRGLTANDRKSRVEIGFDVNDIYTEVKQQMALSMAAPTVRLSLSPTSPSNLKEVIGLHQFHYQKTKCVGSMVIVHKPSVTKVLPFFRQELDRRTPGCSNAVVMCDTDEDFIASLKDIVGDKIANIFVYGCGDSVLADALDVLTAAHGCDIHITR